MSTKIENSESQTKKDVQPRNTVAATGALCFAMLCHTYLLVSPFTYSGFMAIFLIPDLTSDTAGSFAGLISASYMVGRSITSFAWGTVADTIGRKPVFYVSFLVPAFMSIWFGCASNLYVALFTRFSMGMANGIVVAAKTSVSELAKGDEKVEARSMGLVMGMWGWGFLVCPPISGALSEPVKQYPGSEVVQYFEPLLTKYPFLLPNIVSVIFCIAGIITVYLFVDETLPEEKRRTLTSIFMEFFNKTAVKLQKFSRDYLGRFTHAESTPLRAAIADTDFYSSSDFSNETYALTNTDDSSRDTDHDFDDDLIAKQSESGADLSNHIFFDSKKKKNKSEVENDKVVNMTLSPKKSEKNVQSSNTMLELWGNESTRHHLITRWLLVFPSMVFDEAFPLFCIAVNGGLGLTESGIGKILSGAGLVFIFGQYYIYTFIVSRYGLFNSQIIGSLCATPLCFLMPFALYLNQGANLNDITWSAYIYLSLMIGMSNIGNNVVLCSLTISTNRTVSTDQRASMNGLSMLGGSVVKAFGPAIAGFLVSFLLGSGYVPPTLGSVLLFSSMGLFGLYCVYYISVYLRGYNSAENSALR